MPAAVGVASPQRAQEVAKLQVRMALIALGEHFAAQDIKSGKEIDGAMAEILKFLPLDQPWAQRQRRIQALQSLDMSLLIQTQNPTIFWGVQIQLQNLGHVLLKQGG